MDLTITPGLMSDQIDALADSLVKFQATMPVLEKTGANFQRGKAADLGDIVTVAKQATKYELAFSQQVVSHQHEGGKTEYFVTTTIFHKSGQFLQSGLMPVIPEKTGMGNFGAALTYAKKYSLQTVFGIADYNESDLDDDYAAESQKDGGGGGVQDPPKNTSAPPQLSLQDELSNATTADEVQALWAKHKVTADDTEKFAMFEARMNEILKKGS